MRSLWLILLYAFTTVRCQLKVQVPAGDDVLLLCIYGEDAPLPQNVSYYWRDQDDNVVLDSIQSVQNLNTQNQIYRGRVVPAPQGQGNFSIVLKQVRWSDSGVFECQVPKAHFKKSIQLIVTDKRAVVVATPPPDSNVVVATPPPDSNAAANLTRHLLPLLLWLYCVV